jgi:hypothetical protein
VSDPLLDRHVRRRPAVLRHAEDMTGKVAITGACGHGLALSTRNGVNRCIDWAGCTPPPL